MARIKGPVRPRVQRRARAPEPPPARDPPRIDEQYAEEVQVAFESAQRQRSSHVYRMGIYACQLAKMRCIAKNKRGQRCGRTSYYGMPMCWEHLMKIYNVRLGPTSLPGMRFSGLFACGPETTEGRTTAVFHKGDFILPYIGYKHNAAQTARIHRIADALWRETRNGDGLVPYGLEQRNGLMVDSACVRSAAAFANTNMPNQPCNAQFEMGRSYAKLVATRAIRNGEEIIVNYNNRMAVKVRNSPPGYHTTRPELRPRTKPQTCR